MNSRERIALAMDNRKPDRVPVMCQLALGHYFLNCQAKPRDIWFDSKIFTECLIERQKLYGFDGILVNLPGRPENWREMIQKVEKADNAEWIYWLNGLVTKMPSDDNAHTYTSDKSSLPRANYKEIDVADPATYRHPGYIWNTWHMPELWGVDADADLSDPACYPDWFTNAIRHARKLGEEISVHVEVFAPFTHLLELFGYEQALYALLDAPDKCHKLLDVFASFGEAQIEIYAKEKPDAIDVSSAFAGAGFISRDMYREFVMPYEDRLYKKVNNLGLKSCVHTCGAIGDRLGLMAETHVDGVETLDPPPLGTVELSEAIEEFGKRFWFKGNLDAVNEMLNASDADFEKAVKQRLEIGMQGSGYILSSACSVAPAVDPNRLKLMVELAKEFGQYED